MKKPEDVGNRDEYLIAAGEMTKVLADRTIDAMPKDLVRAEILQRNLRAGGKVLFAEGDSWFDFPDIVVGNYVSDVLDALAYSYGYAIPSRASKAGDTLVNMAQQANLDYIKYQLVRRKPYAFLLSAGGNDLFGINSRTKTSVFYRLMNPAGSRSRINVNEVKSFLAVLRPLFKKFQDLASAAGVPMLVHGYGNAYASGGRVFLKWGGPWIKPMVERRGYNPKTEGHQIVSDIGGYFNDMLRSIASRSGGEVHYVDARPDLEAKDWHDELHLWPGGWQKVASKFDWVLKNDL